MGSHFTLIHASTPVSCMVCGKRVRNDQLLKAHMISHQVPAKCPICGINIKQLKNHMETVHLDDSKKPFQCNDCEKGFMARYKLDKHRMNIHIKTQPYRCRYGCENKYNADSNRSAHERRRHGKVYTLQQTQ